MARTGLRAVTCRYKFASDVAAVHKGWTATGMTAAKRAQAVVDAANRQLAVGGTPAVKLAFAGQSSKFGAFFAQGDWRVDLDKRGFEGQKAPSLREMAELVDTVYHECRHAEQWFLVARYLTTSEPPYMTAQELGGSGVKLSVALKAATLPIEADSAEEELAIRFTQCLVAHSGNERVIQSQKDLKLLTEDPNATAKQKKEAKDRLVKLGYINEGASDAQVRRAAHRAYQYQFAEADAWDTGRLAKETFVQLTCRQVPPVPVKLT